MSITGRAPPVVEEPAPAKVNLALHVTARRDDGYHSLDTLVGFTEFGDVVSVEAADEDRTVARGPFAGGLAGHNIVDAARDAMRATTASSFPVHIVIEKNIPTAAGLGGGSADAAAALRALARLWRTGFGEQRLCEIGMPLGADVPMCVLSRPLLASGIGEQLQEIEGEPFRGLGVVLVNPGVTLPTVDVFGALDRPANSPLPPKDGDLFSWLSGCRNDLEAPARTLRPRIDAVLDELRSARLARMSGSGATCFGIYGSMDAAMDAASGIANRQPDWFVQTTRFRERSLRE